MVLNPYNLPIVNQWNSISRDQAFQQFDKRNWATPVPSLPTQIGYLDNQNPLKSASKKGWHDIWSHVPNIMLMGVGTLLFPLLPKPFKMSFKHSLYMAPVHMVMMAIINFGLGFYRSIRNMSGMSHSIMFN